MAAVVPYASLSVTHFINKVGADAGFAAIIGVALVVIMLFVHARETASLRERAEDAEDRVDYLEQTVEHLGRVASQALQLAQPDQSRPGVTPAPATAPGRVPASAQRPAPAPAVAAYAGAAATRRPAGPPPQLPAAPVGTAGPALSSATRLIPESGAGRANGHMTGGTVASAAAPAGAAAAAAGSESPAGGPDSPAGGSGTPAGGSGTRAGAPAVTPPPTPAPSTAAAGAPVAPAAIPSLPRITPEADPPGGGGTRSPRRNYGRASDSHSPRRILPYVVVAVLVAVIAVAAVLVFGHHHHASGTGTTAANRSQSRTSASGSKAGGRGRHSVAVNPRTVTVAVLNGTTTNHLAADVSRKLGKLGFKQGKTANFSDQTQTTTTIGFVSGHHAQALAVAKALKVKYANVLKVTAATKGLVCPAGAACPDQVFVVLGTDLNSAA
jgi:hypothetical protein